MKTIVVTGGAGFIGSAVCRYLIAETDCTVVNVDKLTYAANLESLACVAGHHRYKFYQRDICDESAVDDLFATERPDAVMHLAAESHVDRSIETPADFIKTNVLGTYVLLEASRRYWDGLSAEMQGQFRFLHVSTDEVYGSMGPNNRATEISPYNPTSPYAASKASSDHFATAWFRTYGLPVLVSKSSNNFGPCQVPEKLIPLMILSALEERELPVYGQGHNVRDWLYVEDHVRALCALLARGRVGESYNLGAGNERTNLDVVEAICNLVDELKPAVRPRRELIRFVEDRPGHDYRYAVDFRKITDELGWEPRENFETALRRTVIWYLDNEEWWRPLRKRGVVGQRVGLAQKPARAS